MPKYNCTAVPICILPLNIETCRYSNIYNVTGRQQNLRPEERTCDVCNSNKNSLNLKFPFYAPAHYTMINYPNFLRVLVKYL